MLFSDFQKFLPFFYYLCKTILFFNNLISSVSLCLLYCQGDYNMVINDYVRARALFVDTDVEVFKKGKS